MLEVVPTTLGSRVVTAAAVQVSRDVYRWTLTTPATANTYGAWTEIVASAQFDVYGVSVEGGIPNADASNRATLLDIGVGPAGGEVVVVPSIPVGCSTRHKAVYPVHIPKGSRVAVRLISRSTSVSGDFSFALLRVPFFPFLPRRWRAYGVDPVNGVYGFLTDHGEGEQHKTIINATDIDANMVVMGFHINGTAIGSYSLHFRLRVGSSASPPIYSLTLNTNTAEVCDNHAIRIPAVVRIPAGSALILSGLRQAGSGFSTDAQPVCVIHLA